MPYTDDDESDRDDRQPHQVLAEPAPADGRGTRPSDSRRAAAAASQHVATQAGAAFPEERLPPLDAGIGRSSWTATTIISSQNSAQRANKARLLPGFARPAWRDCKARARPGCQMWQAGNGDTPQLLANGECPHFEVDAHGMTSRNAILSRSRRKKNRRFTGLPGKLPFNRLVTTVMPFFCSDSSGSVV